MAEKALLLPEPLLNPQNNSFLPATKQSAQRLPSGLRGGCHNVRSRIPVRMLYTSVQDAGPSWYESTYTLELCTRRIEERF
jgi:hypothetical protein